MSPPQPQQFDTAKPIRDVESDFRVAVETNPKDVVALSALAQLLGDLGRNDEAAQYFEKAIALSEDRDRSLDKSSCSEEAVGLAMGWYAALVEGNGTTGMRKAEGLYEKALALNPQDCLSMGNYAIFLHRIKRDYKAAAVAYKKAVKAHPTHASTLCKYGSFVKHVEGDHDKARGLFEAAIAASPSHAESLGNLAVLLHGQEPTGANVLDRIEDLYKRAVHSDPANANNFSNYGLFLAELRGDKSGAEALYRRASEIDPMHANSIYNYAVLLDSSLKQHERAEAMYRRCLGVNSEHSYALYNLAVLREEHTKDGDYSEAKQLFEHAVRASPTDALTRADYGRFLALVENDLDGALENLREAMRCDPDCTAAQFNLGKLLLYNKRSGLQGGAFRTYRVTKRADVLEAKDLLRKVLREKSDHSGAHLCLARVLVEEGDINGAVKHAEEALGGKCVDVGAMADLAEVLGRNGRTRMSLKRGEELYKRAMSLAPTDMSIVRRCVIFLKDIKAKEINENSKTRVDELSSLIELLTIKLSRLTSPHTMAEGSSGKKTHRCPAMVDDKNTNFDCLDDGRNERGSGGDIEALWHQDGAITTARRRGRRAS